METDRTIANDLACHADRTLSKLDHLIDAPTDLVLYRTPVAVRRMGETIQSVNKEQVANAKLR
jgi:hypothetical protein